MEIETENSSSEGELHYDASDEESDDTINSSDDGNDVEFSDKLVNVFFKLHRYKALQWIILFLMRVRDMFDLDQFIPKPVVKSVEEDAMNRCHFRTLYRPEGAQDNSIDPDFLTTLKVNTNLSYYTLSEAILATTRLSVCICTCVLYVIVYYHLGHENITPTTVFQITFASLVVGYFMVNMWRFWNEDWKLEKLKKVSITGDLRVSFIWAIFSYLLTPMLRTLTATIDVDTVHAWCTILFGIHLFCNNYGLSAYCVSQALSTNSSIFAMCCLASRLQSDDHCLSLFAIGLLCFICFPHIGRIMWEWPPGSAMYCVLLAYASYTVSPSVMLFYILCMFTIIVIAPSFYVLFVQYKQNIMGPWDEAIPELNVNIDEINRMFEERRASPVRPTDPNRDPRIKKWEAMGIGQPL